MRGGFSRKIKDLRAELIHFASLIEFKLDFPKKMLIRQPRTTARSGQAFMWPIGRLDSLVRTGQCLAEWHPGRYAGG